MRKETLKSPAGNIEIFRQDGFKDITILLKSDNNERCLNTFFVHSEAIPAFTKAIAKITDTGDKQFTQGYICALATLIRSHGLETPIVDAWKCNRLTRQQMRDYEIDETDAEVIFANWDELNHNSQKTR